MAFPTIRAETEERTGAAIAWGRWIVGIVEFGKATAVDTVQKWQ